MPIRDADNALLLSVFSEIELAAFGRQNMPPEEWRAAVAVRASRSIYFTEIRKAAEPYIISAPEDGSFRASFACQLEDMMGLSDLLYWAGKWKGTTVEINGEIVERHHWQFIGCALGALQKQFSCDDQSLLFYNLICCHKRKTPYELLCGKTDHQRLLQNYRRHFLDYRFCPFLQPLVAIAKILSLPANIYIPKPSPLSFRIDVIVNSVWEEVFAKNDFQWLKNVTLNHCDPSSELHLMSDDWWKYQLALLKQERKNK